MNWFQQFPPIVKAFGFALVTVTTLTLLFLAGTVLHEWAVINYGQGVAENMWAVLGLLVFLTGMSWLWQVLD